MESVTALLKFGLTLPQRHRTPRKKAGQMTAPDRSSNQLKSPLAARGPSTDDKAGRREPVIWL
jgi:hypothetical protein